MNNYKADAAVWPIYNRTNICRPFDSCQFGGVAKLGSYYLVVLSLVNLLFLPPFLSPCDLPLFGGGRAESIFRLVEPSSGCCTVKCTTTTTRTTCCNGKQTRLRVAKGTSRADGSNSRASVAKQKHKQKQKQKQKTQTGNQANNKANHLHRRRAAAALRPLPTKPATASNSNNNINNYYN